MQLIMKNVGKCYKGGVWGLRDFSLEIKSGVIGLLGPNGAGKTTLMRILATISRPTEGTVTWNGEDIVRAPNAVRTQLGYLPQDFGFYPNLSAYEFLNYIAALKGLSAKIARQRIAELLVVVNLEEAGKRAIGSYSGGMRQRIGIAQALLNDPKLLIVDEPTVGLDPEERMRFRNLLAELSGDRIVILSTHIVSDIEAATTHIAIMSTGRMLLHDSPEGLLRTVAGKVWDLVVPSERVEDAKKTFQVTGTMRRVDGVHLRILSNDAPAGDAILLPPSLEDAYLLAIADSRKKAAA